MKCKYCNKEFEQKSNNQVFCSRVCCDKVHDSKEKKRQRYLRNYEHAREVRDKWRKENYDKKKQIDKEYYEKNKSKCNKNNIERFKKVYPKRKKLNICTDCGKVIDDFNYERKSITCLSCRKYRLKYNRMRIPSYEKRFEILKCVICNVSIKDRNPVAKYCVECAKKLKELHNKYGWKVKECILFLKEGKRPAYRKGIGSCEKQIVPPTNFPSEFSTSGKRHNIDLEITQQVAPSIFSLRENIFKSLIKCNFAFGKTQKPHDLK